MTLKYERVVLRKTRVGNGSRESLVSKEVLEIKRRLDHRLKEIAAILLYGAGFWLHPKPLPALPRKSEVGLWACELPAVAVIVVQGRREQTLLLGRGVVFQE